MIAAMDVHGIRRHALVDGGVKGHDFLHFFSDRLFAQERSSSWTTSGCTRTRRSSASSVAGVAVSSSPPYSPDTNAIELAFSKIKHHVRKAAATTMTTLRDAFHAACDRITRRDARNYMLHAGYS